MAGYCVPLWVLKLVNNFTYAYLISEKANKDVQYKIYLYEYIKIYFLRQNCIVALNIFQFLVYLSLCFWKSYFDISFISPPPPPLIHMLKF